MEPTPHGSIYELSKDKITHYGAGAIPPATAGGFGE